MVSIVGTDLIVLLTRRDGVRFTRGAGEECGWKRKERRRELAIHGLGNTTIYFTTTTRFGLRNEHFLNRQVYKEPNDARPPSQPFTVGPTIV